MPMLLHRIISLRIRNRREELAVGLLHLHRTPAADGVHHPDVLVVVRMLLRNSAPMPAVFRIGVSTSLPKLARLIHECHPTLPYLAASAPGSLETSTSNRKLTPGVTTHPS